MVDLSVITVTNNIEDPGYIRLKESAQLNGFYNFHTVLTEWKGFGTKIIEAREALRAIDTKFFMLVDSFDVVFVRDISVVTEFLKEMPDAVDGVFSCEKACWPDSSLAEKYPSVLTPWKYLNSGSYLYRKYKFIEDTTVTPPKYDDDDQLYFTRLLLRGESNLVLDYKCELFQSVAFEQENDFSIEDGKIKNNITKTYPVVIHGNGKTPMDKFLC